ncbi:hypothetical protein GA0061099_1003673 [Bradyrhizobium yuanmingense]|uniref:Uncharacterized protein n=1 Tax=Bradyrhizobium yuanmingense TaxID=108015 RepID=A0A1C3VE33_9BRAD|nr:hypothetical protein [Bradyrhizobium yuanmingense]TWI25984.1 hypothetical protein IQ15_03414 [Bradyrhizobium yuanmingense]SCB25961.1 hypothetical protein GA0061099_1003673 [Bradyrhizobium yuanmingense]
MRVKFGDILQAFEFADISGIVECRTFVCRQTGKIYYQFDQDNLQELEDDELPDDIEDETKYLQIPNSRDLDLGKPLVIAFVREFLPNDLDDVRYISANAAPIRSSRACSPDGERSMLGMTTATRRGSGHCAIGARFRQSRSSTDPPFT